ncbi:hypothetical protein NMG60_11031365 [Bertholletia excelsa]
MEKDFGSWFLHQHLDQQSPYLDASSAQFHPGQQNFIPACTSHCANGISLNGTSPLFRYPGIPHCKVSQPNESHGCFHRLPCFCHGSTPAPDSLLKEKTPFGPGENCKVPPSQKSFIVVDQSGGKTTLIFSSGIGNPSHGLTYSGPKINTAFDLNKIDQGKGRKASYCPGPILTDECDDNQGDDVDSKMHEDTEELNALLYSDDEDYYSEDDDEVSTGHSPSTMTANDKQELFDACEEVASSGGPTKRLKLLDGGYGNPALADTACSVKTHRCFNEEGDAGSTSSGDKNLLGNKRSRTHNIRETLSMLKNIIPGGKGKDGMVIIDEAINYLMSLKHKAKALGVNTF